MTRPYSCPCDGDDANCARCADHADWITVHGDADELDAVTFHGDDMETDTWRWTNPPRPVKELTP